MRKRFIFGAIVIFAGLFMGFKAKSSEPTIVKDNHLRGVYVLVAPSRSELKSKDKIYHFLEDIVNDLSLGDTLVLDSMRNKTLVLALDKNYEMAHMQKVNFKRTLKTLCDKGLHKVTKTVASSYEEASKQFTQFTADHKSLIILGDKAMDITKDSITTLGDVKVAFANVLNSNTDRVKKYAARFHGGKSDFQIVKTFKDLESTLSF